MRYEWSISLRYLVSKRRSWASLISLIAVGGVALGVWLLIVVLSVMGGFATDLREKILATKAHIEVSAERGSLSNYRPLLESVRSQPGVVGASPYVQAEVMITTDTNVEGILLRGIDTDLVGETSSLPDAIQPGGELEWLHEPRRAIEARFENEPASTREYRRRAAMLSQEIDDRTRAIEARIERLGQPLGIDFERGSTDQSTASSSEDGSGIETEDPSAEAAVAPGTGATTGADEPAEGEGGAAGADQPVSPAESAQRDVTEDSDDRPGVDGGEAFPMPIIPGQAPAPPSAGPPEGSGTAAGASGAEESGYVDMPAIGPSREPDGDFGGLPPIGLPDGRRRELPGIIIGTELAARLHADVGREVTVINPDGQLLPSGPAPLSRPFLVVATFYTGMIEFDSRFAYVLLPEAQDLLRMSEDEITAIDVRVPSLDDASEVEAELDTELARAGFEGILVRGWEKLNKGLFSALKLEKITMFVILTIVILVASFSIASSLLVTVIERAPEIAILKTMGATNGSVMGIFAIAGGLIGLMGTALGLLAGVGTCLFIEHAGVPMDTEVYYIEYLPVQMVTGEIVMTALAAIVISLLATLYPARKAAQLNPATALRYD